MPTIYVAKSDSLQNWASDVGLTLHVYKLGVSEDGGEAAIEALNAAVHAGRTDWELLAEEQADALDEPTVLARAARKETLIDPLYYPQVKRAPASSRSNSPTPRTTSSSARRSKASRSSA